MAEKRTIEIRLKSKSAESSADRLNTKVKGIGTSADTSEKSMGLLLVSNANRNTKFDD